MSVKDAQIYLPEGRRIGTESNDEFLKSEASLRAAMTSGKILEAKAGKCGSGHDLTVDLGCMKGIIPRIEGACGIESGRVHDIALISRVNKPVCFAVKDIVSDGGEKFALLSRREVQRRCIREYISRLESGDVIDAKITHFEPFGAFCDIGCGLPSLIPIDAISVSRISHPSDRFRLYDDVRVVVKGVEEDGRVSLTHKELLGTWSENAADFHVGETVTGVIRSVESYGVFVELAPNFAGLAEVYDGAKAGKTASVYIKSIIEDKMKVKLIIIDVFDEGAEPSPIKYYFNGGHMEHWQYSPPDSGKSIFTDF